MLVKCLGDGVCPDRLALSRKIVGCPNRLRVRRTYDSVSEARYSIGRYLDFYNARRPHSSLDGTTLDQAYFNPLPLRLAA